MIYNNSAFSPQVVTRISTSQQPQYLFGNQNPDSQRFSFTVTSVAITTNVATVGIAIKSGGGPNNNFVPVVGSKMGVRGTATNSLAFNVDPTTVTAVTYNAALGTGTVSFALTHANVTTTTDVGEVTIWPSEVPDLVAQGTASAPLALVFTPDEDANERAVFCEAVWSGTIPTTATVKLQVANVNDNGRYLAYQNIFGTTPSGIITVANDTLASVASSAVTQSGAAYSYVLGKFVRAIVTSMTGGDGTTALVVTIFA